ncbi:hypothetical protein [Alkalilacustris brevis]|uniref:hypothetical protein n=1 Tax=Alkalilacustris brevis TaxID=2026338 RepID=UPI0013904728|nr:hypothetical protein [Alkalilacustris brevis]
MALVSPDDLVMSVDDDDLVHKNISKFFTDNTHINACAINEGYMWREYDQKVSIVDDFHKRCGTSLIVRAGLYLFHCAPDGKSSNDALAELGSHRLIFERLNTSADPFQYLPFSGAVYRVGHENSSQNVILKRGLRAARGKNKLLSRVFRKGINFARGKHDPSKRKRKPVFDRDAESVIVGDFLSRSIYHKSDWRS